MRCSAFLWFLALRSGGLVYFAYKKILELNLVPLGIRMVGIAHAVGIGSHVAGGAVGFLKDEYVALGRIVGEGEYDVVLYEAKSLLVAQFAEVVQYLGGEAYAEEASVVQHPV